MIVAEMRDLHRVVVIDLTNEPQRRYRAGAEVHICDSRRRGRMVQATACKAVYPGSIPGVASIFLMLTGFKIAPWSRFGHRKPMMAFAANVAAASSSPGITCA